MYNSIFCGKNDRNDFVGMTNKDKHAILYMLKILTKDKLGHFPRKIFEKCPFIV